MLRLIIKTHKIMNMKATLLRIICLAIITIPGNLTLLKAQTLSIPYDPSPTIINGVLGAGEWQAARKLSIPVNATDTVSVSIKHDMTALYFAFTGKLESASMLFPEVLVDPQGLRSAAWMPGQWWLHVSATDCEHDGAYGVYSNCKVTQPGWEGAPNFTPGAPMTDTVEIKLPFSKIGFNPATQDTFGLGLVVTNTATVYRLWPAAADRNIPSTWSEVILDKSPARLPGTNAYGTLRVFPNPASEYVIVEARGGTIGDHHVSLSDVTGRVCYTTVSADVRTKIPMQHLPAGCYFISLSDGSTLYRTKVVRMAR